MASAASPSVFRPAASLNMMMLLRDVGGRRAAWPTPSAADPPLDACRYSNVDVSADNLPAMAGPLNYFGAAIAQYASGHLWHSS